MIGIEKITFNLTDQPWIPCLRSDGERVDLSLRDLFAQAHQLVDISADSPMENAALYRLLLTILHRVCGPESLAEWVALWNDSTFPLDDLERYFTYCYDGFDLFSPTRPFYQSREGVKFRSSLADFRHGTGFTPNTHFNHEGTGEFPITYSPAKSARILLATQNFSFGGGAGGEHSYAPCAFGVLFLLAGETLKETLLLNLTRYPEQTDTEDDLPIWEMKDGYALGRKTPFGRLDYFTWQNRSICLQHAIAPDGTVQVVDWSVRPGLKLSGEITNPMSHYRPNKSEGYFALSFEEEKLLWRNSYSLLTLQEINGKRHHPPKAIEWVRQLIENDYLPKQKKIQCKAIGLKRSNANAEFARQEQFPLPLSLLSDEEKLETLKEAVETAERTQNLALIPSLALAGMHLYINDAEKYSWPRYLISAKNSPSGAKEGKAAKGDNVSNDKEIENWMRYTGVERHYWASLDLPFTEWLEELGSADDENARLKLKAQWQQQVRTSAETSFRSVTQYLNQTPRALKAFAHGNNRLQAYLRKNLPHSKEEVQP